MKDVVKVFSRARAVGTPLIAITTSDQWSLAGRLFSELGNGNATFPKITWDCVRGAQAVDGNEPGKALIAQHNLAGQLSLTTVLDTARTFPPETMLVVYNAQRFIGEVDIIQGIYNLRDEFCADNRTLVMLGPSFRMPAELQDVVVLDEALPTDEQIAGILSRLYKDALDTEPETETLARSVDAARGLSAFAAEQVFAMSLRESGISLDDAWDRKREAVNQTQGLKFHRAGQTFEDLGGLQAFKEFMGRVVNGRRRPGCIVFLDEVEKALAGATNQGGDSSGVSADFLGTLLTWMEERKHDGLIAVGMPGTGKSAAGMAIGSTHGMPTITLDVGGMKSKYVGDSEQAIRDALKVIDSIAGEPGAFVFATCNRETSLPPEFKRRFRTGTWFFDLPTVEEREKIWALYVAKYELPEVDRAIMARSNDEQWTGAEIRNCCDLVWRLDCPYQDAAQYVVPVARSNAQGVEALRAQARNWLSASYPGPYHGPKEAKREEPRRARSVKV